MDVNEDGFPIRAGSPYADDDSIEGEQGKNVGAINIRFGSREADLMEPDIQRLENVQIQVQLETLIICNSVNILRQVILIRWPLRYRRCNSASWPDWRSERHVRLPWYGGHISGL